MSQRESIFEKRIINRLEELFPNSIILKVHPNYLQGFPDRLILNGNRWAAFELKREIEAHRQPNQNYYIHRLNDMSYASFVYPENKEVFFNEIQYALRLIRSS